jgi:hypothetical protein
VYNYTEHKMAEQIFIEAKTHSTERLIACLCPHIFNGFRTMYDSALKMNNTQPIKMFQISLSRVHVLPDKVLNDDYKYFLEHTTPKCSGKELQHLIENLFISHFKLQLIAQGQAYDFQLKAEDLNTEIPKNLHFIHDCYVNAARNVYQSANLFSHKYSAEEQSVNHEFIKQKITEGIKQTINELVPMDDIFDKYLRPVRKAPIKSALKSSKQKQAEVKSATESESQTQIGGHSPPTTPTDNLNKHMGFSVDEPTVENLIQQEPAKLSPATLTELNSHKSIMNQSELPVLTSHSNKSLDNAKDTEPVIPVDQPKLTEAEIAESKANAEVLEIPLHPTNESETPPPHTEQHPTVESDQSHSESKPNDNDEDVDGIPNDDDDLDQLNNGDDDLDELDADEDYEDLDEEDDDENFEEDDDENFEEDDDENFDEDDKLDESAETKKSDESVESVEEETIQDESSETKTPDELVGIVTEPKVEIKKPDESVETKKSDEFVETKKSDEFVETKKSDESVKKSIVKSELLNQLIATVNASSPQVASTSPQVASTSLNQTGGTPLEGKFSSLITDYIKSQNTEQVRNP